MADHEIKKPVLFISHASSDAEFANAVKQEIEKIFANGVSVFCTSSPGTISVGTDWLADIESKLAVAQAGRRWRLEFRGYDALRRQGPGLFLRQLRACESNRARGAGRLTRLQSEL